MDVRVLYGIFYFQNKNSFFYFPVPYLTNIIFSGFYTSLLVVGSLVNDPYDQWVNGWLLVIHLHLVKSAYLAADSQFNFNALVRSPFLSSFYILSQILNFRIRFPLFCPPCLVPSVRCTELTSGETHVEVVIPFRGVERIIGTHAGWHSY